jgi:glycosyltransferase involved in cell wall biosynthesis
MTTRRILALAHHPVQYFSPLMRELTARPGIDLRVGFMCLAGAVSSFDEGFGHDVRWDVPLLDGYSWFNLGEKDGKQRPTAQTVGDLWKLVRDERFDTVLFFTGYRFAEFWSTLAAARSVRTGTALSTEAHTLVPREPAYWKTLAKEFVVRRAYHNVDVTMAASGGAKRLTESLGVPESRVVLTPFSVDNDWWTAKAAAADVGATRARYGIPAGAPLIVFCAKLQTWKRPMDVLRAFSRSNVAGSHLIFAGDGPERSSLDQEANALGVSDRVHFIGFMNQSELPPLYAAADVFVLPSEYEPFGVVVNEAMLCRCAMVVSDRVGARHDLLRHGENGFVFPVGDVDTLATYLRTLTTDLDLSRRMADSGLEIIRSWSPRAAVDGIVRCIDLAMERASRA